MRRRQLQSESTRGRGFRGALATIASFAMVATSLVTVSLVADVVTAPPAEATFAEGGEGLYIGSVDWFDMGADGIVIPADGAQRTNTRTIGEHELATTCTVTPVSGNIQTYRSGDYSGDGFDNLYNIGGADDLNTLVTGIRNTDNNTTVEFDFSCSVTFDGAPLEIGGLVFADAESSNLSQGEYVAATTNEDVTWRVIDRFRNCDTSVLAWLENDRLQLGPDGTQCSQVNGTNGPLAIGFMEGATSARVDLHGGGFSAVSVGVVLQSDFGDAPESYGAAGAIVEPAWEGGVIEPNTVDTQVNVSDESFALGAPTLPPMGLGATIDSDSTYQASDGATADDDTAQSDEDAVTGPITYDTTWGETVTQDVVCRGDGYVTGWIDWNANGVFDAGETSQTQQCAGGTVTLSWVVPDDAVDSLADSPTYMRLRIAGTEADSANVSGIVQGGEVEDHQVVVDVPNPGLTIDKSADAEGPLVRGDTVTYTITVENSGEIDYTADSPAVITDDMAGVTDDATYNDDATADTGTVDDSGIPAQLTWSGPLAVGEVATITYSVTVNDDTEDAATLDNFVTGPPESNCLDGTEAGCNIHIPVVVTPGLHITKTADATEVDAGDTVAYTITVENTGNTTYTADDPAAFADDMTGVIDDAVYNDDAAADVGTVSYTAPVLSWSSGDADFAPGDTATVTYTVTVNADAAAGETLDNTVTGPPESNCLDGTEPDCGIHIPVISRPGLEIEKTADVTDEVLPGDTVTYTVTVENTGNTTYTADAPATFTDDLSAVIDDATYNGDAAADVGAATFASPVLSWSSADAEFAPGDVATITYSVTVNDPDTGDGSLENTVVGPPESNCLDAEEPAAECGIVIPVRQLEIVKTSDSTETVPGGTVEYTVTVTNTGQVPYTAASPAEFTDDLSAVLDDATYEEDAAADIGEVSYTDPVLSWSGALAPGETATITYSVTVSDPDMGDGSLENTVVGPSESNCEAGSGDPECSIVVPVRELEIVKTSEATEALPGDTVTYEITVSNTGQVPYTALSPATFTDDLSGVIDDATYNGDATATIGTTAYAEPTLSWSGALAPGESATITYTVTVNDPATGDGSLENVVVGPSESNCLDAEDPVEECGVVVPVRQLEIVKTSSPDQIALPGGTVDYTITVTNTGQAPYTALNPATFTDDLTDVIDDATYNDDASADSGEVSYTEPVLSWSGALAPGETATITYSVTVADEAPAGADGGLDNTVVGPPESNCEVGSGDPDCTVTVPIRELQIVKTADADEAVPGDTVTYTIEVTNTGEFPFGAIFPARFDDNLVEVLDDAVYNGDATADTGTVTYAEPVLHWEGELAAGETATITYTVTVADPDTGDGELTNVVSGPPVSNCSPLSDDFPSADCAVVVPVRMLEIVKTSESAEAAPGDTVDYTITVANTGQVPYTAANPATFTDDLTAVLDDAVYDDDATADIGEVSYTEPVLSWSGALAPGETATITYSVTVNAPVSGDGLLDNAVVGPPESDCDDGTEDGCHIVIPVRALEIVKTSGSTEALPGDTVAYEVVVTNTGAVPYGPAHLATFDDDLSAVIDDAAFNGDATATAGAVSYAEPTLHWEGELAPGASATITYSVVVNDPDSGDGSLENVVVGPAESNCLDAEDPAAECGVIIPVRQLEIVKTSESTEAAPGDTVEYTITVTNTGQAPYTGLNPATLTDDLTAVLDDATYGGDATADVGEVSYTEPVLSWSGALAPGATATIAYTVVVNDPPTGDGVLDNAVVGPPESGCDDGTEDGCHIVIPVRDLEITKSATPTGAVDAGDDVTYTVTVTNTGQVPYTAARPASFTDDLTAVLDDAAYGSANADVGEVSYTEPVLSWSGALAPGETATVTYTVTVNKPLTGDGILDNVVVGPDESNCPPDSDDPSCSAEVLVRALFLQKTSDGSEGARPGDVVTYTITATNVGQVDYTDAEPASFDDDLTEVLDDAAYDDDASADIGAVSYADPVISWVGALAIGETATITYSVTVDDPATGDGNLFNVVVGPNESNCTDATSTDPDCIEPDPLRALHIVKTAEPDLVANVGDTITYTVQVTNTGTADYTADDPASFTDVMVDVLDDAVYDEDVAADKGTATYDDGELSWSGPLASGETATVTYSVTVNDTITGDGVIVNTVLGPEESNCPVELPAASPVAGIGETNPQCMDVTPVRAFEVSKTVDKTEADEGDIVTYTVTVTALGKAPYTDADPAGFTDDLTEVLDDAAYNGDATAVVGTVSDIGEAGPPPGTPAGEVAYSEPTLTWSGPLAIESTVTVTYSVTVDDPDAGDHTLINVVTPAADSGGNCASDEDCTTRTDITGHLPATGGGAAGAMVAIALLLLAGGGLMYQQGARRRRA